MNKNSKKSVTPCFKRWSRKNWSVFASLHKVVKIGVLSLGMSILTLPYNVALAQKQANDTVRKEMLDEIKVVTQRSNPTRGMISPVQAYSRVKMVNLPLQTVETALKVNPAVDLRERGAKGVQADISLFGGSTDQTMIMLNGVNFTDAQTGHQSHALPIDLEGVSGINLIGGVPGIGAFTGGVRPFCGGVVRYGPHSQALRQVAYRLALVQSPATGGGGRSTRRHPRFQCLHVRSCGRLFLGAPFGRGLWTHLHRHHPAMMGPGSRDGAHRPKHIRHEEISFIYHPLPADPFG